MFICSPVQNIRQRHIDASVFSFYLPVKTFETKKASLRGIRSRYLYIGSAGSNFHFVTFNNIVERIIYPLVSHSILVFLPGGGSKPFPFHSSFLTAMGPISCAIHRKMVLFHIHQPRSFTKTYGTPRLLNNPHLPCASQTLPIALKGALNVPL